jgi:hypothetical protein
MRIWITSVLITSSLAPALRADVVVDQENYGWCCIGYSLDYPGGDYMAQTFTVNHTGHLVEVGIQVSLIGNDSRIGISDDLHVKLIRTDSAGAPDISQVLASRSVSPLDIPFWSDSVPVLAVDFSDDRLQVHSGEKLAIALISDHTAYSHSLDYADYMWHLDPFDPLPGGDHYVYSPTIFGPEPFFRFNLVNPEITRDAGFRVLIDVVPEPSAIVLVAIAWVTLRSRRSRNLK